LIFYITYLLDNEINTIPQTKNPTNVGLGG